MIRHMGQKERPRCSTSVFSHLRVLRIGLLNQHRPLLVVSWLINANHCSICLNLVDIASLNPNALRRVDGRSHYRSSHNRGCHYWRSHNGCRDNWTCHYGGCRIDGTRQCATNYSTNEAGPEVRATASPEGAVVMIGVVHHGSRTISKSTVESTTRSSTKPRTTMRSSQACSNAHCSNCHCDYCFLVHFSISIYFVVSIWYLPPCSLG